MGPHLPTEPGGSAARAHHSSTWLAPACLIAMALGETAALTARIAAGGNATPSLLVIHLLSMALLAGLIIALSRSGRDSTHAILALIAGAATGPVGIMGAAVLALGEHRSRAPSRLVTAWYERIALSTTVAPEERLCEDVNVGRTIDLGAPLPASYADAMITGPLGDRQAILGHIARHFHPAYLPTLKIALASPEAVLRVQAAAVAAHISPKVRRSFAGAADAAARAPTDPLTALGLLDDLETLADCGLLDESERQRAEALATRLGDTVLAALGRGTLPLPHASDVAEAARLEVRLERLLIARRRFADLRAHRTARRLRLSHPTARHRRLAVRDKPAEVAP